MGADGGITIQWIKRTDWGRFNDLVTGPLFLGFWPGDFKGYAEWDGQCHGTGSSTVPWVGVYGDDLGDDDLTGPDDLAEMLAEIDAVGEAASQVTWAEIPMDRATYPFWDYPLKRCARLLRSTYGSPRWKWNLPLEWAVDVVDQYPGHAVFLGTRLDTWAAAVRECLVGYPDRYETWT